MDRGDANAEVLCEGVEGGGILRGLLARHHHLCAVEARPRERLEDLADRHHVERPGGTKKLWMLLHSVPSQQMLPRTQGARATRMLIRPRKGGRPRGRSPGARRWVSFRREAESPLKTL